MYKKLSRILHGRETFLTNTQKFEDGRETIPNVSPKGQAPGLRLKAMAVKIKFQKSHQQIHFDKGQILLC